MQFRLDQIQPARVVHKAIDKKLAMAAKQFVELRRSQSQLSLTDSSEVTAGASANGLSLYKGKGHR